MEDDDLLDNFDYDAILNQATTQNTQTQMTPVTNTQSTQSQLLPPPSNTQTSQAVPDSTPSTAPIKVERKTTPTNFKRLKTFGKESFSADERERIRLILQRKLTSDDVQTRPGPSGGQYTYVSSNRAIELANESFQFNGWSCSIVEVTPDFIEERDNKVRCGVSAVVRVMLRDGTHHEDVGFGCQENASRALAIENAKKEAISDARKRALRLFGNYLGNCLYDKEHVNKVRNVGGQRGNQQSQQQQRAFLPQVKVENTQQSQIPQAQYNPPKIENNQPYNPQMQSQMSQNTPTQYNQPYNPQIKTEANQYPPHPNYNPQVPQNNVPVKQENNQQYNPHMQPQMSQNTQRPVPPRVNNWQPQNNAPINTISPPKAPQPPSHFVQNNNTYLPQARSVPAQPNNVVQQQQQSHPSLTDSDDFALEEALLLAESNYNQQQQSGQKSPHSGEYAQGLTPPDKKRKSGDGIFVN